MITKAEMAMILGKIGAIYGKEIKPEQISSWRMILNDHHRMAIADAAMVCVQKSDFMPLPNQIIKTINEFDLDTKWQMVEPSIERTYWVLFTKDYDSTDNITEKECREIFNSDEMPKDKLANEITPADIRKAGEDYHKTGRAISKDLYIKQCDMLKEAWKNHLK